MSVSFVTKSLEPYTAPEPDPRDSESASRTYLTMHRIHGEHCARVVGPAEAGGFEALDTHPADALGTVDLDLPRSRRPPAAVLPEGAQVVDAATAGVIVAVADALNDTNRAKFLAMDLAMMGHVAWELASK